VQEQALQQLPVPEQQGPQPQLLPLRKGDAPPAISAVPEQATAQAGHAQQQEQPQQQQLQGQPSCANVRVQTRVKLARLQPAGAPAAAASGTVLVLNRGRHAAALERVGVRLCSRAGAGAAPHLRVEAVCPQMDVPPRGRVECAWSVPLPAAGQPGADASAWVGAVR
jgi:hypothetical protein